MDGPWHASIFRHVGRRGDACVAPTKMNRLLDGSIFRLFVPHARRVRMEARGSLLDLRPVKVMDVELSRPLQAVEDLNGYRGIQALIRLHGAPLHYLSLPVVGGRCSAAALEKALREHGVATLPLSAGGAETATAGPARMKDPLRAEDPAGAPPLVTVAVCTRDHTADLARCLESLQALRYPCLDVVVVDNAPATEATAMLVRGKYPQIRYIREERPGLNWARNRGIAEARGELIAYTDDDVVVDPGWIDALVDTFAQDAQVMAVTGLVAPLELETEAQILFEERWSFGKGFERQRHRAGGRRRIGNLYGSPGNLGTGANMAFRVSLFSRIGGFDPALDAGTSVGGGGDLEMFFRLLKEGYTLIYEPKAIVRHRHRRHFPELRRQLTTWGSGFYAHLLRSAGAYPEERLALFWVGTKQFLRRNVRHGFLSSLREPSRPLRGLLRAEAWGALIAWFCYRKSRSTAARIEQACGPMLAPAQPAVHPGPAPGRER